MNRISEDKLIYKLLKEQEDGFHMNKNQENHCGWDYLIYFLTSILILK